MEGGREDAILNYRENALDNEVVIAPKCGLVRCVCASGEIGHPLADLLEKDTDE